MEKKLTILSKDLKAWPSLKEATAAFHINSEYNEAYCIRNKDLNKNIQQCAKCGCMNHLPICRFCE